MKANQPIFSRICIVLCSFFLFFAANVKAQLLTVSGKKIVKAATNEEVILQSLNFGNWMVMEGYMMNSASQAPNQHTWKKKLTTLIGATNTATFYNAWVANHVTRADIAQAKAWGFNSVRLPLHYEYFVNLGSPDVWNPKGFETLDSVIAWCAAEQMYAVIDLHAAPGGQSDGAISDYDNTKPSLWESPANQTKTVKLWRKFSERYKNEPWVAAYDLINEPAWNLPGGTALKNIYTRLTDTIRGNGDNHMLFIEGNWYSNDYTGLTPAWDANMVYVFHKYWNNNTDGDIKWVLDLRNAQNRPIWCGEHGENSNDNFTKTAELLDRNGIGTSWWPMKKFEAINDFADGTWPAGYQSLLNYFGGTNPNLNPTTAFNTLMQLAENVKLANMKLQTEVVRAVSTQPGNRTTAPFAANAIPGRIYASQFDMGMNGYAYFDKFAEDIRLTTGTDFAPWNTGWTYRNTGVDLEKCTDTQSNGTSVGWFDPEEWMQYTCNVATAGTYTIEVRAANGNATPCTLQFLNAAGTEIIATATVQPTGGWATWATTTVTGGFATTGSQGIRVVNAGGGCNLAAFTFTFDNANIPAVVPAPNVPRIISLKGNNGKYVSIAGDNNNLMVCTKSTITATEEFTVIDAGDGLSALRGSNGRYVSYSPSTSKLYCNSTVIGANQKFLLDNINNMYTLKGANSRYVSSENGATTGITCTRTSPGGWEFFNWATVANPLTSIAPPAVPATFAVYPNPAHQTLSIRSGVLRQAIVTVSDVAGKTVLTSSLSGFDVELDIAALAPGIYCVQLAEGGNVEVVKFVKE